MVFCLMTPFSVAAVDVEVENPYKNAKIGDWAKYKKVLDIGLSSTEEKIKISITTMTDHELTVESETTKKEETTKVPLSFKRAEKLNLIALVPEGTVLKQTHSGEEIFFIAGKILTTLRTEYDLVYKSSEGIDVKVNLKVWTSQEVGVGVVKIQADVGGIGKLTVELESFGSATDTAKNEREK
jgi:hypothetical protein